MDRQAFYKIYNEAEEAIAERRLYDAISLIEAILSDTIFTKALNEISDLRLEYGQLLDDITTQGFKKHKSHVEDLFRHVIYTLQMARVMWLDNHLGAYVPASYNNYVLYDNYKLLQQLKVLRHKPVGDATYHTTLDSTFNDLWHVTVPPINMPPLSEALQHANRFAQCTLVSALLLGVLDRFSSEKIRLLLALGETCQEDRSREGQDLAARIAVALTIIYQRYKIFFRFFTKEMEDMRKYISSEAIYPYLATLLQAFTAQSVVENIKDEMDDIIPNIRTSLENSSTGGATKKSSATDSNENNTVINKIFIDPDSDQPLFNKMMDFAKRIEEMRQANLDIQYPNFSRMKNFPFFMNAAHWFYPFSTSVPAVRELLEGDPSPKNHISLSIIRQNKFCSSDCYSFMIMTSRMNKQMNSFINNTLGAQEKHNESMLLVNTNDEDDNKAYLDPFVDYCQSLHRFFCQPEMKPLPFHPFAPNALPLVGEPLFAGLFSERSILPSINCLTLVDAHEQIIELANSVIEYYDEPNAALLKPLGNALMALQKWDHALPIFQELSLIDDSIEVEMNLAKCFEAQKEWHQALFVLQKVEETIGENCKDPKAIAIIEATGRCLITMHQWNDAVQRFFRLELMGVHINIARRAIAWCSIHQGKYERAITYYQKLIESQKATWEDHLNLGHATWLSGDNAKAVEVYRQSQAMFNSSRELQRKHFKQWSEAFQEDVRTLLSSHLDDIECSLMLDALQRGKA